MIYLPVLFPIILAFAYRSRGMSHPWGDTVNRIVSWAIPVGLICSAIAYLHNLPVLLGIPCAVMAFAGACIGHSTEQQNTEEAHIGMAGITTLMLGLILLPVAAWFIYNGGVWHSYRNPIIFTPLGTLGGIAYWLGYKYPFVLNLFGIQWTFPNDASCGEFLTGLLAFGIPLMLLGI
jgi:hypothetical protein